MEHNINEIRWDYGIVAHPDGSLTIDVDPEKPGDQEGAIAMVDLIRRTSKSLPATANSAAADERRDISLGDAIHEYLARPGVSASTSKTYNSALRTHLLAHFGSTTVLSSITQQQFAAYVNGVRATVQRPATLAQRIGVASALFKHFREQGYNVKDLTTPRNSGHSELETQEREHFEDNEVRNILADVAATRQSKPAMFWLVALLAFTGARLEEVAQLNLKTDLRLRDGIWYIDINQNADPDGIKRKRLKTKTSKRSVPIHSLLVDLGLIAYFNAQTAANFTRPFEAEYRPLIDKKSKMPKWSHYLCRVGSTAMTRLATSDLVDRENRNISYFHSWRHTVTTALSRRGVPEEQREALTGHKGKSVHRGYTHLNDVEFLSALIEEHLCTTAAALRTATGRT